MGLLHREILSRWCGTVPYEEALACQYETHAEVLSGSRPHTLLLLEHPPVYTFGKRGGHHLLRLPEEELRRRGASLCNTDRGGLVTFHGPGQLVGYPILDLRALQLDLTTYIQRLLQALEATLRTYGLDAVTDMDRPGIYVEGRKIGALGVRLRQGATLHGFAINVTTDLSWFDHIIACGLVDVKTTSIARETGDAPTLQEVGEEVTRHLAEAYGLRLATTASGGAPPAR